jgi:hypothetical protein
MFLLVCALFLLIALNIALALWNVRQARAWFRRNQ